MSIRMVDGHHLDIKWDYRVYHIWIDISDTKYLNKGTLFIRKVRASLK